MCELQRIQKLRVLAALASYVLAYYYADQVLFADWNEGGYAIFVFTVCFFALGEALVRLRGVDCAQRPAPNKEAALFAVCSVGIAVSIVLHEILERSNRTFMAFNHSMGLVSSTYAILALHACAAYWVVCRFGWLTKGRCSAFVPLDALNALVFIPFGNFFLRIRVLSAACVSAYRAKRGVSSEKKPVGATLGVLAVFAVFFAIALQLLCGSDAGFAQAIQGWKIQFRFSGNWSRYFGIFLLSLPVGAYLCGLFGGCLAPKTAPTAIESEVMETVQHSSAWRVISVRVLTAVLCAFVALYALYFSVQIDYFVSAFVGRLPAEFTFAEYARKGYFELCQLMALNMLALALAAKCTKIPLRQTKALKAAAMALLLTSLLFAAMAFTKIAMYISVYGLTELRMFSMWGVGVSSLAVILAMVTIQKPRPVMATLVYSALVSFTVLCFLCV